MIGKSELSALIPHAGDMCLLDAVEEWTPDGIRCTTRTHLAPSHPLRRHGQLAAVHLVEYAAQAVAAHGALRTRLDRSKSETNRNGMDLAGLLLQPSDPQPGMLGVLRDIRLFATRVDTLHGALTVAASRRLGRADGLVYDFAVTHEQTLLCDGRVVIAFVAAPGVS